MDKMNGMECKCEMFGGLLSLVLMTAGFYFLVWGFMLQTQSYISWKMWNWPALSLYLAGFVLLGIVKMIKHKHCCDMKGNMKAKAKK